MATAEADVRRLDPAVADRVIRKLRWLAENVDSIRAETLTGRLQGVCKLRVGSYRVLYTADAAAAQIVVHFIRHRRDIYKTV